MRVAFLGNADWSVPSLVALAAHPFIEVVGVFTRPPVPAGRGSRLTATPVADAARELGLPLVEVSTVCREEGLAALHRIEPDVIAVVAYGEILSPEVLAIASIAPVNLHFSLLPSYRGSAPVQRALLDGVTETGVSVMLMDEGMDTGDILTQRTVPIGPDEDSGTLGARLAELGAGMLAEAVAALGDGAPRGTPQDDSDATTAPRIPTREIDWMQSAERVVNLVRALAPRPGAATELDGTRLKVLRAAVTQGVGTPGTLLRIDPDGPVIATSGGAVLLLEVAPAGRRHMTGAEFARGARLDPRDRRPESS